MGDRCLGHTDCVGSDTFSEDFLGTARREAARLADEAGRLRHEAASHQQHARQLNSEALLMEQRVRELRSVLEPWSGSGEQASPELRGQEVRDVAVEVLLRHRGPGATLHYRQWFGLLQQEGYRIAGRDALATFLTQIRRSPVVRPASNRAGYYVVDLEQAGAEAVEAVRAAEAELSDLRRASGSGTEEVERARRALAKAERTLSDVARWQGELQLPARPLSLVSLPGAVSRVPSH